MNMVEIKRLQQVQTLMERALDGKVENLKTLKHAKEILDDVMEFKELKLEGKWWIEKN